MVDNVVEFIYCTLSQMEEIKIPMVRGSMDDIGDEEVNLSEHTCTCMCIIDMYYVYLHVHGLIHQSAKVHVCCLCVQGSAVGMSQSAETGSSTAMMDVDSMTSQVRPTHTHTHTIIYYCSSEHKIECTCTGRCIYM